MSSDRFNLTPRILNILADGKWHRLGEFVPLLSVIPPEQATQRYTTKNGNTLKQTIELKADKGRILFLRDRLGALKDAGQLEIRALVDGGMEYRLIKEKQKRPKPTLNRVEQALRHALRKGPIKLTLSLNSQQEIVVSQVEVTCDKSKG